MAVCFFGVPKNPKDFRGVFFGVPKNPKDFRGVLLTKTETCNDGTITLDILLLQIVKVLSSLTYHDKHTSAGVVILGVCLKMSGKLADSLSENCDLNLGRTGITFVNCVLLDDLLLEILVDHWCFTSVFIYRTGKTE